MFRRARGLQPLAVIAVLFTRMALAADPAPALSKHWRAGSAAVRLVTLALLATLTALLVLAALRVGAPLARWVIH